MSAAILCPFSPVKTEQSFLVFKAHLSTWTLIPFSPPAFSNIFLLLTMPSFCGIFNLLLWTGPFPLVFSHVEIYPKSFKPWCSHCWILLYLSTLFHLQTPANSLFTLWVLSSSPIPLEPASASSKHLSLKSLMTSMLLNPIFRHQILPHFSIWDPGDRFHHLETWSSLGCRVLTLMMFILSPLPFFLCNVCWLVTSAWLVKVAVTWTGLASFIFPYFLECFSSFRCFSLYSSWVS